MKASIQIKIKKYYGCWCDQCQCDRAFILPFATRSHIKYRLKIKTTHKYLNFILVEDDIACNKVVGS